MCNIELMKKCIVIAGLVVSSLVLGGCGTARRASTEQIEQSVIEKKGTVTVKLGKEWLLGTSDGIVNMTSTKVNLDNYLKKMVTVRGMFSGSTLYVDEIEEK